MPRLHVMLLFYLISGYSSQEILSDLKFPQGNGSEEITIPTHSAQFFRNSFKCCHHSSTYNSNKRVCLYSSGISSSRWKEFWDPIDPDRVHRTPNCSLENVLVDYELVVKVEREAWESGEKKLNNSEPNCETKECRVDRVRRIVSTADDEVETFSIGGFNSTSAEDQIGRLEVLTAKVVSGGSLEGFTDGPGILSLFPNGTLKLGRETFAKEEFCVDGRDGEEDTFVLTLRVCESSISWCLPNRICVRKCCSDGESMLEREVEVDGEKKKKRICAPSTLGFQIQKELPPDMPLGVYNGVPCGIRPKYILRPETRKGDIWHLTANGSLAVPDISSSFFPQTEYCLENIYDPVRKTEGLYAYLCFPEYPEPEADTNMEHVVYPGALLISCFFLFATLAVYALLPTLRNLHGLTLVSHASCLLAAFICLAAVKLTNEIMIRETMECKILGYSILFTFLAALSWLNVMCFDIWWTFGGFRGRGGMRAHQRGASGKGSGFKGNLQKYIYYSIYAWMLPFTITAFTIFADLYGEDFLPYGPPGIGLRKCWFADDGGLAVIIHFVVPSTILLIADVVMFILTALKCWKVKAEIHRMQSKDKDELKKNGDNPKLFGKKWWKKKYQGDKERMVMNLKLCTAMGINWSLEIASWWLSRGEYSTSQRILPMATWYASDVANCLHGVFVFIVFVGKKKILKQLWKRCKDLCSCCEHPLPRQTTGNSRNSSSQDSTNMSSVHVVASGAVENKYSFDVEQEAKYSCLRKWLNICKFCKNRSERHTKFKNRCLSQTSSTSINVSEEVNEARVSFTP